MCRSFFCSENTEWDITMIHFQTTLRQLCSPISTFSMDPEPFRKFLSSTKLYATGTKMFVAATLSGLAPDFIVVVAYRFPPKNGYYEHYIWQFGR